MRENEVERTEELRAGKRTEGKRGKRKRQGQAGWGRN